MVNASIKTIRYQVGNQLDWIGFSHHYTFRARMTAAVQRLAPGVPFGEGLNLTAEMMATGGQKKAPAREPRFEPWSPSLALPMRLTASLAKPPLEAICDSKSTQPAHAGHLAGQRCRRLLAGVSCEV
jgi:hypothetical protein